MLWQRAHRVFFSGGYVNSQNGPALIIYRIKENTITCWYVELSDSKGVWYYCVISSVQGRDWFDCQLDLKRADNSSASASSLSLCIKKPLRSDQNSSVSTAAAPLGGSSAAGACSGSSGGGIAAAPPSTMTENSIVRSLSPSRSFRTLLSGTGFLWCKIFILATGILVWLDTFDLMSRMEVLRSCEVSLMSRGGFRRDLRVTVTLRS